MQELKSYLSGEWVRGHDAGTPLLNPTTGETVATASSEGLDLGAALRHLRTVGGPALRALTFRERGALLVALSKAIHGARDELLELSRQNTGTTLKDSKFDIDGATATLAAYGKLGEELGDRRFLVDPDLIPLGRSPRFCGTHVQVPKRGVAVHINAFNFPAWGFAEKAACAWLAGMPVLTKPATATALPAFRIAQIVVDSGILPAGAWGFLCGGVSDLLDHLRSQDVVAFTGSADTGIRIRGHATILRHSVPVNVEADSLNAAVLGPDVEPGNETWNLFVRELVREMTQKAGQKCTATRRVLVPEARLDAVIQSMKDALGDIRVGLPTDDASRMGVLSAPSQVQDVINGVTELLKGCELVHGSVPQHASAPALVQPMILVCRTPKTFPPVHEIEVFGPATTLMAYSGSAAEAAEIVALGDGALVTSVYSDDLDFVTEAWTEIAPYSGRVLLGSRRIAEHSTGPGLVLPELVHGGPGRAGGGLELGGVRGLTPYLQTSAVQGARPMLERLLQSPGR